MQGIQVDLCFNLIRNGSFSGVVYSILHSLQQYMSSTPFIFDIASLFISLGQVLVVVICGMQDLVP